MDPSDTAGDLTQAKAKINEAYLSVCHDGNPWDFLETEGQWSTVAGSDKYSYATIATGMSISGSSIREILYLVNDTDGFLMRSMDWYQHETDTASTQESSEGQGTPDSWSKWGGGGVPTIRIYPNPDAVYTIGAYVALTPANMTADADTPMIPLAWRHRILVPYAAALLLEQEGGAEAASGYDRLMARYERNYQMMRTALGTGKRGTFNQVAPNAFDHLPHSGNDWYYQ